jgi:DNA recombination-dependent growth factor C
MSNYIADLGKTSMLTNRTMARNDTLQAETVEEQFDADFTLMTDELPTS